MKQFLLFITFITCVNYTTWSQEQRLISVQELSFNQENLDILQLNSRPTSFGNEIGITDYSNIQRGGCFEGTLVNTDSVALCPGESTTTATNGDQTITPGGSYSFRFIAGPGGTGANSTGPGTGFSINIGTATTFTFDAGVNGILAANSFPNMAGYWLVSGFVRNAANAICSDFTDTKPVNFLPSSTPSCVPPDPCEASSFLNNDSVAVCPTFTASIDVNDAAIVPTDGEYRINFIAGADGTGANSTGPGTGFSIDIDPAIIFVFDAGLNGILAANSLPDMLGTWALRGFVQDADGGVCSFSTTSKKVNWLLATHPDCLADICDGVTITSNFVVTNETNLGDHDGAINLTPGGGTSPYSYSWSNGATTEDLSNLAPGTYTVTITDANGCTGTGSATVAPGVDPCASVSITSSFVVTNETNLGDHDGAINLTPGGGTSPYTYSWSNGATTEDISGLAPGTYTVTITDANGCTGTGSATVAPGVDPCAAVTINSSFVVTNETNLGDGDGIINLTPGGGTSPYTYSWSNGATTEDLFDLAPGTYTVTITDANGCTGTGSATVAPGVDPCAAVTINSSFVVTNETNLGDHDGAINLTPGGGTSPYTYSWSNGATTEDLSNLAPGTYTVTITDANGCTGTGSATVAPGVDPCASVTITSSFVVTNETNLGDHDGAINLTPGGGTSPYTYSWSNGTTTEDLSNLAPGTYTVTITDANGCTGTGSATVAPGVDPCASVTITVSLAVTNESVTGLEDGAINATITGGATPYTYSWNNGATTEDIDDLAPGEYTLVVTDNNGCIGKATGIVEEGAVGVNEIKSLNRFSLFPNPVKDILNFTIQFDVIENVRIQILDVVGRKVIELPKESVLSKTYSITPALPIGLYFVKVLVDDSFEVEPFVVQ